MRTVNYPPPRTGRPHVYRCYPGVPVSSRCRITNLQHLGRTDDQLCSPGPRHWKAHHSFIQASRSTQHHKLCNSGFKYIHNKSGRDFKGLSTQLSRQWWKFNSAALSPAFTQWHIRPTRRCRLTAPVDANALADAIVETSAATAHLRPLRT